MPRLKIGKKSLRNVVRKGEVCMVRALHGKKLSKKIGIMYANYDMIMRESFDFEATHPPNAKEVLASVHN